MRGMFKALVNVVSASPRTITTAAQRASIMEQIRRGAHAEILGLDPSITDKVAIKDGYRSKIKAFHPDSDPDPEVKKELTAISQAINRSYELLTKGEVAPYREPYYEGKEKDDEKKEIKNYSKLSRENNRFFNELSFNYTYGTAAAEIIEFASALENNRTLQNLSITWAFHDKDAEIAIFKALQENKALKSLSMASYKSTMDEDEISALSDLIKSNRSLESMNFFPQGVFDDKNVTMLCEALDQNYSLREFQLSNTATSTRLLSKIDEVMRRNSCIPRPAVDAEDIEVVVDSSDVSLSH